METLNSLLSSSNIQLVLPLLLLGLVLYTRSRVRREMLALSQPMRDRLFRDFGRYRMMQFMAVLFIILPVIMTGFRLPFFIGREYLPFLMSAVILVRWFTMGYEFLKRKLQELDMPESFVSAYLGDRLVMALTLSILLYFGWQTAVQLS